MQRASTFAESRRHMTSLVAGLAALALAIAGQGYVAGRTFLYDGLFLYAIAVILAVRALDLAPPARDSAHDSEERAERAAGMQLFLHDQAGRTAAIVAVAANVLALRFFGNNNNLNLAWLLYAASVVVAPVAVWLLAGRPRLTIGRDWRPADALALAVVFVVAVFFRLYQIDSLPFGLWWDEAFSGLAALRILSDLGYRPVYEAGMAQEPSLLWYLMVPSVWLLGPQNIAIRLPAIVGGLTGVVATFLLARELFGQRTAVVASAFVAMMAWHVNFSRIGFNAIWSVTLDALATCFLIQALRTRRLLTFALAGTALGLGANMYYTTRLMPFILLIYLAHRLLQGRVTFIRQNATGLAVFVLVTLITVSPLGLYGIQHPKEFGSRADQVTIFKEMAERQSSAPLVESIRKHLAMFHYQGDPNGRHNLPGAPMLDRVIGGLFVVGLALAVRQVRQPRCSLLVTWTVVMLVGGIFSLGFEAPQGLRTIDEITGIAILAALPVATLWERLSHLPLGELRLPLPALGRWREPLVVSGGAIAVVGLVAWVGSLNYQRYFVEMARDFAVWNSFSTAETEIARQINTLSGEPSVYLGETFIDKPTIQFLATRARAFNRFDPPGQIPLRQPVNTAIFLEPEQERSVALLKRLYPRADLRVFASPYGGPPVLYTVIASAADIESLRGLAASYYAGLEWSGQPVRAERVSALDVDWTAQLPLTPPFSAEWRSTLATPLYGRYVFRLEAPEGSELLLDESPLVRVQAQGGEEKAVILPKGNHALRLRVPVSAPTSVRLLWQPPSGQQLIPVPADVLFAPPATNNGLLGSYYRNREWSGTPALQQIDPHLDLRFHILPLPRPYSIEWVGKIDVPRAGIYRFAVQSVDASSVFVDGNLVASNQGAVGQLREGAIQLTEGFHDIKVRYVDETTFTFVKVFWTPPGGQRVTLPSERLFPPQGAYRERAADLAPIAVTPPTPVRPAPAGQPPAPPPPAKGQIGRLPKDRYTSELTFGQAGEGDGQLLEPRGVAVDDAGNVYVADTGNARVQKFDKDGNFLAKWGRKGEGEADFLEPVAVVIDPDGNLVVLDAEQGWLKRFTTDGKFLGRFGGPPAAFYHPRGLDVDAEGNFYVADTGTSSVARFNKRGELVGRSGEKGTGAGQLVEPTDVLIAPAGGFYVADSANSKLVWYDSAWKVQAEWPLPKSGSAFGPHLAMAGDQSLFVSDADGHRIIRLSRTGEPLAEIGGEDLLKRPLQVAVDGQGNLYVADSADHRIVKLVQGE